PTLAAETAFTYTNPIVRFLNASGDSVGMIDAQGQVAFGYPYAAGPLVILGVIESRVGTSGKQTFVSAGQGGPADASNAGGAGGPVYFRGGTGGVGSAAQASGNGGSAILEGGTEGTN